MGSTVPAKSYPINLVIEAGATFAPLWTWKTGDTLETAVPVDLTGATARMHIRAEEDSDATLYELTTENGRITLGDENGTIELEIPDADSAAFIWEEGVYDLEIEFPDGTVRRWSHGCVRVVPNVTR